MTTAVVTVCSHERPESYYHYRDGYLGSLAKLGVEPIVLGFGEEWRGLCDKPKRLRHWLRHVCTADIVIATDANDVVFQKHPDEIVRRWKAHWPHLPVIFNAERNLFPRGDLAEFFPETDTPWRYLNSGFMIGTRDDLLTMIETVEWDAIPPDHQLKEDTEIRYGGQTRLYRKDDWFCPNDQGDYQYIYSLDPVPIELDSRAELCIACHGSQESEFDWSCPKIRNLITDTTPGVFHANGDAKEKILPRILAHMGLA